MAEFFIVRGHRRQGFGMDVAQQVFLRFPGRWQVRVRAANEKAHRFWEHTIAMVVGHAAESALLRADGKDWHVFSLNIPETS
jgi:predicted acetyltransferase